jgi:threonine aldolase
LVGPKDFINKAKHFRKMFGGGIRQCGLLVAAAKYSFDKVFPQLPVVHQRATRLAQALHKQGVYITVPCDTNMVFLDVSPLGFTIADLCEGAAALKPYPITLTSSRLVLHHQIVDQTVDDFVDLIKQLKEQHKDKAIPPDPVKIMASEANSQGKHSEVDANFGKRVYGPATK